jgi:hypothetical protein
MRHTPSFGLLAVLALLVTASTVSAVWAASPQETLHFNSGETKTNCRLVDVVGASLTYRCPGQGWSWFNPRYNTATRLQLNGTQDKMTLKTGETLTGELMFKDDTHYEMKTDTGLKRVEMREVTQVEMGLPTSPKLFQPSQPLPEAYTGAVPAPVNGLLLAAGAEPLDDLPVSAGPEPSPTDVMTTMPVTEPSSPESPAAEMSAPKQPRSSEAKPLRRLVTPATSPWKIDKPYGGDDFLIY